MKTQTPSPSVIGIDIAKDKFDAVHLPTSEHAVFDNNNEGIKLFIKWARKRKPTIIVCEATGGYQNDFVRQLIKANLPIHTANPARIKHYIASLGTKAKTDKSDARYIAMYALERQPESMKDRGETHRKLKECLATRRQFVDEVKRLKCQVKHLTEAKLKSAMQRVFKHLKQEIEKITAMILQLIEQDSELKEQFELLQSVPSIGKITAITLLVDCPELGEISAVKASALAGLAPYANQSGTKEGQRSIFGGRSSVRSILFLAAMSVTRMKKKNVLTEFYEKLLARGKSKMSALIALAHKILRIASAILKKKQRWNPNWTATPT